jgi:hypothetical protein
MLRDSGANLVQLTDGAPAPALTAMPIETTGPAVGVIAETTALKGCCAPLLRRVAPR